MSRKPPRPTPARPAHDPLFGSRERPAPPAPLSTNAGNPVLPPPLDPYPLDQGEASPPRPGHTANAQISAELLPGTAVPALPLAEEVFPSLPQVPLIPNPGPVQRLASAELFWPARWLAVGIAVMTLLGAVSAAMGGAYLKPELNPLLAYGVLALLSTASWLPLWIGAGKEPIWLRLLTGYAFTGLSFSLSEYAQTKLRLDPWEWWGCVIVGIFVPAGVWWGIAQLGWRWTFATPSDKAEPSYTSLSFLFPPVIKSRGTGERPTQFTLQDLLVGLVFAAIISQGISLILPILGKSDTAAYAINLAAWCCLLVGVQVQLTFPGNAGILYKILLVLLVVLFTAGWIWLYGVFAVLKMVELVFLGLLEIVLFSVSYWAWGRAGYRLVYQCPSSDTGEISIA
ncbi:MAG: hypothetical protein SFX18_06330 [Pirellulales bacterium]|nr:hypothetical protein [Pirellulales bacterium]